VLIVTCPPFLVHSVSNFLNELTWPQLPLQTGFPPPERPLPHGQPFLPVQAISALVIHRPPFSRDQNMEPSVSVPDPGHRQISKAHPKRRLRVRHTLIANRGPGENQDRTGPPLTDLVGGFQEEHQIPLVGGL